MFLSVCLSLMLIDESVELRRPSTDINITSINVSSVDRSGKPALPERPAGLVRPLSLIRPAHRQSNENLDAESGVSKN